MYDIAGSNIAKSPLFTGIPEETVVKLLAEIPFTIKHFNKGETIIRRGAAVSFYIMSLSGHIMIVNERINGERIIDLAQEGIPYGLMSHYSGAEYWVASVEAGSPCSALFLPQDFLFLSKGKFDREYIVMAENMLSILGKIAFHLSFRMNIFSLKGIREKIAYYLVRQSEMSRSPLFDLPYNRNEMAEFLNVSRPSLSRELANMKADGIIDYYKNTISIKNAAALSDATETE